MAGLTTTVGRDLDTDVTVVTVGGDFVRSATPVLRGVLYKCMTECPAAVIVDLTGARTQDVLAFTVFPTALRNDPLLPYVPLLLCLDRRLTGEVCLGWDVRQVIDPLQLIASELVTNAVLYAVGGVRFDLTLRREFVRVRVSDTSRLLPRPPPAGPVGAPVPGGRGLHLVDAYSAGWGAYSTVTGKVVWATVRHRPLTAGRTHLPGE